jgi:hypothetical protein
MATISRSGVEINKELSGAGSARDEPRVELCALEQEISAGAGRGKGGDRDARLLELCASHSAIEEEILILSESLKEEPERLETLCTKQGAVMKEVVLTPALTIVGVAVKLNLWRQTQLTYLDENTVLWDSLAEDLFLLSGVAVTKFYPETWVPNTL